MQITFKSHEQSYPHDMLSIEFKEMWQKHSEVHQSSAPMQRQDTEQ